MCLHIPPAPAGQLQLVTNKLIVRNLTFIFYRNRNTWNIKIYVVIQKGKTLVFAK